jgi:hypothetical protein
VPLLLGEKAGMRASNLLRVHPFHLVLSHLVWAAFSLGWDTSKCQITA